MQFTDGNLNLKSAVGMIGGIVGRGVVFSLALLCVLIFCGSRVNAASVTELKGKWREKKEYPVRFLDENLQDDGFGHAAPKASDEWFDALERLGATGVTYALNPPEDVLRELSSKELAELFLKWPWLHLVNTYDTQYNMFFSYAELNSDIFYELLGREDGCACILEAYRDNPFDVDANNANPDFNLSLDLTEKAEIFGCKFIQYYHQNFTQKEYELACEIMKEKAVLYEKLNDAADVKRELSLDPINPPAGETKAATRAIYFTPEQRDELWTKMLVSAMIEKEQLPEESTVPLAVTTQETQGADEGKGNSVDAGTDGNKMSRTGWLLLLIVPATLLCGGAVYAICRRKHK